MNTDARTEVYTAPYTTAVEATPYAWPWHGSVDVAQLALVVLRQQGQEPARSIDEALRRLAEGVQAAGGIVVAVTDGDAPLPFSADTVLPAPATSAFHGSTLDDVLRRAGRTDLLLAGWGLESAVHSTMRAANDRGYECLLVPDACSAVATDLIEPACSMVMHSGGIFGAHASSRAVLEALAIPSPESLTPPPSNAPDKENTMTELTEGRVDADPYAWPYDGALDPARTALILIDWQVDFCGPGGYVDQMGYDLSLTRSGLMPTARVLATLREWGCTIVHTREGHRPDLSDCPPNKLWRSQRIGAGIGDAGPCGRILVRGEPGWEIVPEVAPIDGELVIDKPGKGAFYATDLDLLLRNRGITHLIFTGITTDVCVHTTMRDANDRGYECLLLSDCTGATDYGNYEAALKMVTMQGGVFGSVAPSESLLAAIMTAKLHTPGRIVAIDLADSRLAKALEFGADVVINNGDEDAVARVMALTGGLGADVAIEAVGVPATFELCTELIRPGGRVANVGVHGKCAALHLEKLWIRDVTITTGIVDTRTTPMLLRLIEGGRLDPTVFATHHFPLAQTVEAYDVFAAAAETGALKVVLQAVPAGLEQSDTVAAPIGAGVGA